MYGVLLTNEFDLRQRIKSFNFQTTNSHFLIDVNKNITISTKILHEMYKELYIIVCQYKNSLFHGINYIVLKQKIFISQKSQQLISRSARKDIARH